MEMAVLFHAHLLYSFLKRAHKNENRRTGEGFVQ